jgi:crotonobetainyl-CoA:carnitine CoA-transferase CaiB-like acyl-CoA transferase
MAAPDTNQQPKKHSRTKYSDVQRAETLAVLDSNNNNLTRTAEQTKVPFSTIKTWNDGAIHPHVAKLRAEKKPELADIFENIARTHLTNAADENKIDKTSSKDSVLTAGIAVDKMLLLRGQPTSIVQTQQSRVEHYITITRKVAEKNNATVEEVLTVLIDNDRIPAEFVEDVKRVLLGDGR